MSRLFTAADRSALIRLASDLPKGSEERRAILAGLGKAAATQWIGYIQDPAGYMARFFGPSSKGGISRKMSKLPLPEFDWDRTMVNLDAAMDDFYSFLHRKPSDRWFRNLPPNEKRVLDGLLAEYGERRAVLAGLKTAAESFDSFESGDIYRHEALSLIKKLGRPFGIKVRKVRGGIAEGLLTGGDSIQDWSLVLMPSANPKRQGVKIGHGGRGYSAGDKLEVLGFYDVSRLSPEQLVKKHLLKVISMGEW